MNHSHWIDSCPNCQERLVQFYHKKSFPVMDQQRDGWSGIEAYYCAGCDKILIAVGFTASDRDTFFLDRTSTNGFVIPDSPPARAHPCYLPKAVASAAVMRESAFERLRRIRSQIGARTQPDEPRFTVVFENNIPDISKIRDTLHQWLTNSQSGSVTSLFCSASCETSAPCDPGWSFRPS